LLTFSDAEFVAHTSHFLRSPKHHHRPALRASAAILLPLKSAKCTPQKKEALVDLKQEIDY